MRNSFILLALTLGVLFTSGSAFAGVCQEYSPEQLLHERFDTQPLAAVGPVDTGVMLSVDYVDSSRIPIDPAQMSKVAETARLIPDAVFVVQGVSDEVCDDGTTTDEACCKANVGWANGRAHVIADYMVRVLGIDPNKIVIMTANEAAPISNIHGFVYLFDGMFGITVHGTYADEDPYVDDGDPFGMPDNPPGNDGVTDPGPPPDDGPNPFSDRDGDGCPDRLDEDPRDPTVGCDEPVTDPGPSVIDDPPVDPTEPEVILVDRRTRVRTGVGVIVNPGQVAPVATVRVEQALDKEGRFYVYVEGMAGYDFEDGDPFRPEHATQWRWDDPSKADDYDAMLGVEAGAGLQIVERLALELSVRYHGSMALELGESQTHGRVDQASVSTGAAFVIRLGRFGNTRLIIGVRAGMSSVPTGGDSVGGVWFGPDLRISFTKRSADQQGMVAALREAKREERAIAKELRRSMRKGTLVVVE